VVPEVWEVLDKIRGFADKVGGVYFRGGGLVWCVQCPGSSCFLRVFEMADAPCFTCIYT
jgi:hypothetical protein